MKQRFLVLVLLIFIAQLSAQTVSNIRVSQDPDLGYYCLTFDLSGEADDSYDIIVIPYKNGKELSYPRYLSGKCIANLCSSGKDLQIFWNPALEGVEKEGWQFRVSAKPFPKNFVLVEGGSFLMGSNSRRSNEKPVHQVSLSSFYMGKYEVSQKEWREVMGNNPSKSKGDNLPVECVTWYDAVEYCNKRSLKEGLLPCYSGSREDIKCDWTANGYRLPMEAEWEYAARGGKASKGYEYSGSNDLDSVGWYRVNSESKTDAVGGKVPNELGLYDMSGNVWEWCWDIYGSYPSGAQYNPTGSNSGSYRVLRGGSWYYDAYSCTVSYRAYLYATVSYSDIGFRVCRVSP